ncbi:DUF6919 domain-containing protein [Pseudarthrobacter sp. P1]|uniref:DUF6919 domain-containing protein n=1 Tax=Pseudarthrobacter sp. P1 TaxID=3418418 RepID=UPI003CF282DD
MKETTTDRDAHGRLLADRGVWRQATTIEAAGELTARWLEGQSHYQPGTFAASFDEETGPIAAELAAINRNGFFTKESQPGLRTDAGTAQRGYVTGYCSAATASRLLELSTRGELVTVGHAPGETNRSSIPVTIRDGEVATVLGSSESPVEAAQFQDWSDETNETLALALADSWYVEIFDPVWGRKDQLLPAVLEALKHSGTVG